MDTLKIGLGLSEDTPVRHRLRSLPPEWVVRSGGFGVSGMQKKILALSALRCIAAIIVRRADGRCGSDDRARKSEDPQTEL